MAYAMHGDVAVITLDNPPVNGPGLALRRALLDDIDRAGADAAVAAIVLIGAGAAFSGGADIREFGTPDVFTEPLILSLAARLEQCGKPTVAALHGVTMGGGLELAMGAHFRVFAKGAGRGWYLYEPGKRDALPDPEVDRLVAEYAHETGVARRKISDDEIVQRCIYALVNEGARIVEEGIALRAPDINIIYLAGYGFPRHRGGPMNCANEQGRKNFE